MKSTLILLIAVVTLTTATYSNGRAIDDLCKRDLTRRILRMIGVNADSTPCLVQSKRDLAILANSAIADIRERDFVADPEEAVRYPTEVLTSSQIPTVPPHSLPLKAGTSLMLTRKLRPPELDEVLGRMSYSAYDRRGFGNYDGKFCCSPSCDRYMAHLGVSPAVVEC